MMGGQNESPRNVLWSALSTTHNDARDAHELEEFPDLLIVLLGGSDLSASQLVQPLVVGNVLLFLFILASLFTLSESPSELQ